MGVTTGRLDPSSSDFSALIVASLCISILGAGVTCFTLEAIGRNGNTMTRDVLLLSSRYGVVVVLLRSAQHCVLVLSAALLGCAVEGWAAIAVVLGVAVFFCSGYEAVDREGSYTQAVLLFLAYAALVSGIAAAFAFAEHADNNYSDTSLEPGGPGAPQYFFCGDRTAAVVPAAVCFVLSCVLFPASAVVDPVLGLKFCKARTCKRTQDCLPACLPALMLVGACLSAFSPACLPAGADSSRVHLGDHTQTIRILYRGAALGRRGRRNAFTRLSRRRHSRRKDRRCVHVGRCNHWRRPRAC